jgi:hypothetical protein
MSKDFGTGETTAVRADFLVELRGLTPDLCSEIARFQSSALRVNRELMVRALHDAAH